MMPDSARLKQLGVRAMRTMIQTAAGMLGTAGMFRDLDWRMIVSATVLAGISCVLMHLGQCSDI
jgi:hypothetical protein